MMTPEEAWAKLTPRERNVMTAIVQNGGSTKEAARDLGMAKMTMRNHRSHINLKLGAASIIECWIILGWLVMPPYVRT